MCSTIARSPLSFKVFICAFCVFLLKSYFLWIFFLNLKCQTQKNKTKKEREKSASTANNKRRKRSQRTLSVYSVQCATTTTVNAKKKNNKFWSHQIQLHFQQNKINSYWIPTGVDVVLFKRIRSEYSSRSLSITVLILVSLRRSLPGYLKGVFLCVNINKQTKTKTEIKYYKLDRAKRSRAPFGCLFEICRFFFFVRFEMLNILKEKEIQTWKSSFVIRSFSFVLIFFLLYSHLPTSNILHNHKYTPPPPPTINDQRSFLYPCSFFFFDFS